MKRHGNDEIYFAGKSAALEGRIRQRTQNNVQFRLAPFETYYHILKTLCIDARSGYPVELEFPVLAVATCSVNEREFAGVTSAGGTIIAGGAVEQFVPAFSAKLAVRLADIPAAINAHGGPKQVVYALPRKRRGSCDCGFCLSCIHGDQLYAQIRGEQTGIRDLIRSWRRQGGLCPLRKSYEVLAIGEPRL
jgi:hypothetical protein